MLNPSFALEVCPNVNKLYSFFISELNKPYVTSLFELGNLAANLNYPFDYSVSFSFFDSILFSSFFSVYSSG